jgi:RNA ligase
MIDSCLVEEMLKNGFIKKNKHPQEDLYILNYTPKTQYECFWNEITTNCRGLIVNKDYQIVGRCFKKFFNYSEVKSQVDSLLLKQKYTVYEKIDGSLGISYFIRNKPFIATRGSFESEQSIRANKILESKNLNLDQSLTYLFEIIYPENTIVVNYGKKEDLILLSAIETATGKEIDIHDNYFGFETCKKIDCNSIDELKTDIKNFEGYVVKFDDGYRFKIKLEEYVRIHKVLFGLSSRDIWACLKSGSDLVLEGVPDEIFSWIKKTKLSILKNYSEIDQDCKKVYKNILSKDRKEFAIKAKKYKFSSVLFKLYDDKPYEDIIWDLVRPDYFTYKDE